MKKTGYPGKGFNNLGRTTLGPGESKLLRDTFNRNARVLGAALHTSLPNVVTFDGLAMGALPFNIGNQPASAELLQLIPFDFKASVGQSIIVRLTNHGSEEVVVSLSLLTDETFDGKFL